MKSKLVALSFCVIFIAGALITRAQVNCPEGSYNFYQDLYGTTTSNRGASDALFYTTGTHANDFIVPALTNQGFIVTIAASYADFNTKLATGNYNLAVVTNNGICCYLGLDYPTVQNFINNGGCMIFNDWEQTQAYANLFEASFIAGTNVTPFTITDPQLAIGITNPVAIANTDWGIWSTELSAIGSGEVLATFPSGSAAIVRGNNAHTILLGYLSDTPPAAERQLLFENVIKATTCGGYIKGEIPVSNWAIVLGLFLIVSFAVIRFVKTS
jgi:hypothetical protein